MTGMALSYQPIVVKARFLGAGETPFSHYHDAKGGGRGVVRATVDPR
jgi:hypothetical protein